MKIVIAIDYVKKEVYLQIEAGEASKRIEHVYDDAKVIVSPLAEWWRRNRLRH